MICKYCGSGSSVPVAICPSCGKRLFDIYSVDEKNNFNSEPDIESSENHNQEYKREQEATLMGTGLLILSLMTLLYPFKFTNVYSYSIFKLISGILSLIIRVGASRWVMKIAERQNRESVPWGIFGFIFPSFALIIIGQMNRLKDKRQEEPLINSTISQVSFPKNPLIKIPPYSTLWKEKGFSINNGNYYKIGVVFEDGIKGQIFQNVESNDFYFFSPEISLPLYFDDKEQCISELYQLLFKSSLNKN